MGFSNGQKGTAITLVNPAQLNLLRRVMINTKAVLVKGVIPSADEVAGLKIKDVLERVGTMKTEAPELELASDLIQDLIQAGEIDFKELSKEDLLARFIVAYFPNVFVKNDSFMDYMGDRIPRELLPRDAQDNRFTRNRESGGDDRGPRRGGGRFGGRGGGGGFRGRNDRGDRGERAEFSGGGERAERPRYNDRGGEDRAPRAERGERSFRATPSEGGVGGFRSERAPRAERSERSERPTSARGGEARGGDRPERRDHPGIKRFRAGKKRYDD